MPSKPNRAFQLSRDHVRCDVTGMIMVLAGDGDEDAFLLLHGDPEGEQVAYPAKEVLVVTEKLARRLRSKGQRVTRLWCLDLWARSDSGSPVSKDTVIEEIAQDWTVSQL